MQLFSYLFTLSSIEHSIENSFLPMPFWLDRSNDRQALKLFFRTKGLGSFDQSRIKAKQLLPRPCLLCSEKRLQQPYKGSCSIPL